MDRRTLILCLGLLSLMIIGTGLAVAFLYSGENEAGRQEYERSVDALDCCRLFNAVPSDAVAVGYLSECDQLFPDMASFFGTSPVVFSLHYSGKMIPLLVFSSSQEDVSLERMLLEKGYKTQSVDGFLVASESDALIKSACRHVGQGISILDDRSFAEAAASCSSDDVIFVSNSAIRHLLPFIVNKDLSRKSSDFLSGVSQWMKFDLHSETASILVEGYMHADDDKSYFISVLKDSEASVSRITEILPSMTLAAVSIPMKDLGKYMSAYGSYMDSKQKLHKTSVIQKELGSRMGIRPDVFMKTLDVREVAVATFASGDTVETVNLLNIASPDPSLIFKGTDVTSLKDWTPEVHAWHYASFAAASFGELFERRDESCFTYIDGWLVTGSLAAVNLFLKGQTYTLEQFLSDAGCSDMPPGDASSMVAYFSLTENDVLTRKFLSKEAYERLSFLYDGKDCSHLFLCVGKDGTSLKLEARGCEMDKVQSEIFARDTLVLVPEGPFKVKNSHTGKTNLFYQNSNKAICLQDENGKDLWGVPFGQPLCGRVQNVDYYANGKIQFLFGAGSKIYLIDRLSRYVKGFPVDLGNEILLGPDVYDFSGAGKYNIMVLHKDGTVQMYNLKGKKPDSWKGIRTTGGVIKNLPERIIVGGSSFWVVRTSIQTLIFPFYGGEAITRMDGNHMIRPDSVIKVLDASSVEVTCYDGKVRTVKLK
ncbi:MAG: hypothetical protein IJN02_00265 [Bacteroidales bacterium]|nr:hypothetical protein [Bacteroidales bacterium]